MTLEAVPSDAGEATRSPSLPLAVRRHRRGAPIRFCRLNATSIYHHAAVVVLPVLGPPAPDPAHVRPDVGNGDEHHDRGRAQEAVLGQVGAAHVAGEVVLVHEESVELYRTGSVGSTLHRRPGPICDIDNDASGLEKPAAIFVRLGYPWLPRAGCQCGEDEGDAEPCVEYDDEILGETVLLSAMCDEHHDGHGHPKGEYDDRQESLH